MSVCRVNGGHGGCNIYWSTHAQTTRGWISSLSLNRASTQPNLSKLILMEKKTNPRSVNCNVNIIGIIEFLLKGFYTRHNWIIWKFTLHHLFLQNSKKIYAHRTFAKNSPHFCLKIIIKKGTLGQIEDQIKLRNLIGHIVLFSPLVYSIPLMPISTIFCTFFFSWLWLRLYFETSFGFTSMPLTGNKMYLNTAIEQESLNF